MTPRMHLLSLLGLGAGLAADAVAVSLAATLSGHRPRGREMVRAALVFGLFQGTMPLLGLNLGQLLGDAYQRWGAYLAFVILLALGLKTLWEGRGHVDEQGSGTHLTGLPLLSTALATSLDALAAGPTLPYFGLPSLLAAATIGMTTTGLTLVAMVAARHLRRGSDRAFRLAGGTLLIALGLKILLEHPSR
ncbi:MAG: hypothetical protein D6729_15700 [Deltaproteobacteria bacterium]|nr:MAG: hypothetical protein D6729_15700 [Deltaproteobacteria bacterium]